MSTIPTLVVPFDLDNVKSKNPHVRALVSVLKEVREYRGAVYTTSVDVDIAKGEVVVFLTTSKDTHLGLGEIGRAGQFILAKTLEYEFRHGDAATTGLLMLNIQKEKRKQNDDGMYSAMVTVMSQHGIMTYTFSPAH